MLRNFRNEYTFAVFIIINSSALRNINFKVLVIMNKKKEFVIYDNRNNPSIRDEKDNVLEKNLAKLSSNADLKSLCDNNDLLQRLLSCEYADRYFGDYFLNKRLFSEELENIIAESNPDLFCQLVRTSKSFLREEKNNFYKGKIFESVTVETHKLVWNALKEKEVKLWNRVDERFKKYIRSIEDEKYGLLRGYVDYVVWLEERRFQKRMFGTDIEYLSWGYNIFVEMLFRSDLRNQCSGLSSVDMEDECARIFDFSFGRLSEIATELFESISSYVDFLTKELDPYCYDLTFSPKPINKSVFIEQQQKDFGEWKLNGIRYELNKLRYQYYANQAVDLAIKEKRLSVDGEANEEYCSIQCKVEKMLEDLCLSKVSWKGQSIDTFPIFSPLIGLSVNRLNRYERPLFAQYDVSRSYKEAADRIRAIDGDDISRSVMPFEVHSKWVLKKQASDSLEYCSPEEKTKFEDLFDKTFSLFCFDFNDSDFDRYNLSYDVMQKPFIRISDEVMLTATMFLGNEWLYSSVTKILDLYRKNINEDIRIVSNKEFENKLAECFENKGWTVIVDNNGNEHKSGDVDVKVKQGDTLLLIQLKRTTFKLTPKDVYKETIMTDRKAVRQLNLYESNEDADCKIVKWYVTTSYENCLHEYDGGVLKVNYFDLLYLLEHNPDKYKNLSDLIDEVNNDYILKSYATNYFLRKLLVCFPFDVTQCKPQLIPIKIENDIESRIKAVERTGNADKKFKIAENITNMMPEYWDGWHVLGVLYFNKKMYDKAIECFRKALQVAPDEPYLLQLLLRALEAKRGNVMLQLPLSEESLEIKRVLKEKYWYIDFNL